MKHTGFYDEFFKKKIYRKPTINKNILFNLTVDRFLEHKNTYIKPLYNILDIGCGPGHLINKFLRFNDVRLTGFDITSNTLEILSGIYSEVSFNQVDFSVPQMLEEKFDVITAVEVLEHIPHDKKAVFLKNCSDALSPGGILILTTPNKDRMFLMPKPYRVTQPVEDFVSPGELSEYLSRGYDKVEIGTCLLYVPNIYLDAIYKRVFYPFHVGTEQRLLRKTDWGVHIIATAVR